MSEWIGMGDWRLLFLNRDRLRKTTVEDVQRVAAKYFKSSNRTVGLPSPMQMTCRRWPLTSIIVPDGRYVRALRLAPMN